MPAVDEQEDSFATLNQGLIRLLIVAGLAGVLVGLIGGGFHWALTHGSQSFAALLAQARTHGMMGVPGWALAMVTVGLSVAFARWLVTLAPSSAGSGVQHVEAVMRGQAEPAPFIVLPVKFVGGLLAMVPGLALGREGPTIQMAAVIGTTCGRWFGLNASDRAMLYTGVAGSGLSVAFNAPLAGAAFVIEEVAHRTSVRRLLTTLIAVGTAMAVYRGLFGNAVSFDVAEFDQASTAELFLYGLLGAFMGALGVLYNKSVIVGLNLFAQTAPGVSPVIKAGLVGSLIGLLAYAQPSWVGGGEWQVNAVLASELSLNALVVLLAVRWVLGPVSYSMGTPGGLFAPLLLVGATTGALFASGVNLLITSPDLVDPVTFALVAMAAFFTAVVRAPFTGVILICEMSGTVSLMIPLLLASVVATLVASLMRGEPIYDSLRARMTPERLASRDKPWA